MKGLIAGTVAIFSLVLLLEVTQAQGEKAKYNIKEVMKQAMKGGLTKKVSEGTATEEEKKQLVELFVALHENNPPKGEKGAWEKATLALVQAAKAAEKGDEKAGKAMAKLANCANCHKQFKGK